MVDHMNVVKVEPTLCKHTISVSLLNIICTMSRTYRVQSVNFNLIPSIQEFNIIFLIQKSLLYGFFIEDDF